MPTLSLHLHISQEFNYRTVFINGRRKHVKQKETQLFITFRIDVIKDYRRNIYAQKNK